MSGAALPRIGGPEEFARAFRVSPETVARLEAYAASLALWQRRINLVSPTTLPDVWHRHFADSAQLLALAPSESRTWIDIGSGAGFPGLVVAILLADRPAPRPRMTLVESDQRKAAFLGEVVRRTGLAALLPVDILCARIESDATRGMLATADVVSARALAPLVKLLELASPLLAPDGRGLFLKGRDVKAEIATAARSFEFSYDLVSSRTESEAGIVVMHGPARRTRG
ncbi:MAG: 16S rRNA (guanine(527)-N(7))-methyltransferase RsmG [Hyphomicrobiaceae bacterium]